MNYSKIAGPIFITIIIYVVLGSFFILLGTTIYDDFPTENFTFNENKPRSMILRNNAPFTFPYVNPAFMGSINITNSTGETNCFVESRKGKSPCGTNSIDLGYIPTGEDSSIKVTLTPNNNNFTLKMNAYLNYLINIPVKSKTFKCINQGNNLDSCNQI